MIIFFIRQFSSKSTKNYKKRKFSLKSTYRLNFNKQPQTKMINFNKLSPFKRIFYSWKAKARRATDKYRFFQMNRQQSIFDEIKNNYNTDLSYRYQWFNLGHESTLAEWSSETDVINGGDSTAQLWFDQNEKCIEYEGYVETKDKDRMIAYPYIKILRSFPIFVKIGPMRLLQIEAKTDGKPLEVHLHLKSCLKGEVEIYGFILSKSKDWHTYEIPIENMILKGTEEDYHEGGAKFAAHRAGHYFTKHNHEAVFDKEFESVKKILTTEVFGDNEVELSNVGFRLVSSEQSENRNIRIRNINFAYKKGYEKFVDSYKSPYCYITDDKVVRTEKIGWKQGELEFLENNLEKFDFIDTGDIKYYRKDNKQSKSNRY